MPAIVQALKNRGEEEVTLKADGTEITVRGTHALEKAKRGFDVLRPSRIITP
jgi:hypothetical protein